MSLPTLFHYTSRAHLPNILRAGFLTVTESNIGSSSRHWKPYGEHVGPDVVWLTEVSDLKAGHGLDCGVLNKLEIRFTVKASAIHWPSFAAIYGINKSWYRALNRKGGGSAKKWWVSHDVIPASDWVEVYDIERGCSINPSAMEAAA